MRVELGGPVHIEEVLTAWDAGWSPSGACGGNGGGTAGNGGTEAAGGNGGGCCGAQPAMLAMHAGPSSISTGTYAISSGHEDASTLDD